MRKQRESLKREVQLMSEGRKGKSESESDNVEKIKDQKSNICPLQVR